MSMMTTSASSLSAIAARDRRADVAGAAHHRHFAIHICSSKLRQARSLRLERSAVAERQRRLHVLDDRVARTPTSSARSRRPSGARSRRSPASRRWSPSMPFTIRSAASSQPRWRNIISPERITEPGLTLSWPAYFGAVPCVASNTAWPVTSSMLPPGAMPMPPTCAAQRVGQVVAVQVRRRDHVVLVGPRQDLLEHAVGDASLITILPPRLAAPDPAPRPRSIDLRRGTPPSRPRSPSRGTRPR